MSEKQELEDNPPSDSDTESAPSTPPPDAPLWELPPAPLPSAPDLPPPPTYTEATAPSAPTDAPSQCSYIDFSPRCLRGGNQTVAPIYERFDILVGRVNEWLEANPTWKVITMETLKTVLKNKHHFKVNTLESTYHETCEKFKIERRYKRNGFHDNHKVSLGKPNSIWNRSLRVWIVNKTSADDRAPQRINYINLMPLCIAQASTIAAPQFENSTETIRKFNQQLAQKPLPGRVVNIETEAVQLEYTKGTADPDTGVWMEEGQQDNPFIYVIRVFYEMGEGTVTAIGTADFPPQQSKPDPNLKFGCFESLIATRKRARACMEQLPSEMTICNVQSLDYKLDVGWGGTGLDTARSFFMESAEHFTLYLRIIRVYWTQGFSKIFSPPAPIKLSHRTFIPVKVGRRRENQIETAKRALNWVNATGAKVLCCETAKCRFSMNVGQNGNPEVTYYKSGGMKGSYIKLCLRLWVDGDYVDPPPEVWSPPKQKKQSASCGIM